MTSLKRSSVVEEKKKITKWAPMAGLWDSSGLRGDGVMRPQSHSSGVCNGDHGYGDPTISRTLASVAPPNVIGEPASPRLGGAAATA